MRKLQAKDMFKLSAIIDKMGFKINALDENGIVKPQAEVGMEMFQFIISKIYLAQDEIIDLIADLTQKSKDEVEQQSPKEIIDTVKEILAQDGVLDFLK